MKSNESKEVESLKPSITETEIENVVRSLSEEETVPDGLL